MADALVPVAAGAALRHRVTWRDDHPAAHQIRLDAQGGVGCSCTDDRITVPWSASLAEVWEAVGAGRPPAPGGRPVTARLPPAPWHLERRAALDVPDPRPARRRRRPTGDQRATSGDRRITRCGGCGSWTYQGWCRTCEPSQSDLERRTQ